MEATSEGPFHLLADSKGALRATMARSCTSQTVQECQAILNRLADKGTVLLHWVKARVGHTYNERADQLAKEGALGGPDIPRECIPDPWCWIKSTRKAKTLEQWQERLSLIHI